MLVLFYNNKVILSHAKRGSRLLTRHTMYSDLFKVIPKTNNDSSIISKEEAFDKIKNSGKKVYCLNRNPLSHISSGMWNIFEYGLQNGNSGLIKKTYESYKQIHTNFDYNLIHKLMYLTTNSETPYLNKDGDLSESISQKELLELFNFFIFLYNKEYERLEIELKNEGHVYPNQSMVKAFVDEIECDVVDIDKVDNLLAYLGFNSANENEKLKKLYSQKAYKKFFDMYLDYILNGNIQTIKNKFEEIYNNTIEDDFVVNDILQYQPIIEHINNEIKIYNEIDSRYPLY